MKRPALIGAVAALCMVEAACADARPPGECAAVEPDAARLACYDHAAGRVELGESDWSAEPSFMGGQRAHTASTEPVRCRFRDPARMRLSLSCYERSFEVTIFAGCFFGAAGDPVEVSIKGGGASRTWTGVAGEAGQWLDLDHDDSLEALQLLFESDSVSLAVTPPDHPPVVAVFDTRDAHAASFAVRRSCDLE
jgi:hypothetical protein